MVTVVGKTAGLLQIKQARRGQPEEEKGECDEEDDELAKDVKKLESVEGRALDFFRGLATDIAEIHEHIELTDFGYQVLGVGMQ